jgi:hypothetical protein
VSLGIVSAVGIAVAGPLIFARALLPLTFALAVWFTLGAALTARWGVRRGAVFVVGGVILLGLLLDRREVYAVYFAAFELGPYARGLVPFHLAMMTLGPMMFGHGRRLVSEARSAAG